MLLAALALATPGLVIRHATLYDGTGRPPRMADVRVVGDTIREVGTVKPRAGDTVMDAKGLALAPGFIDCHNHADGDIFGDPDAETTVRQGITTGIDGVDGGSRFPLRDFFARYAGHPGAINLASYVGQGTVRKLVMGNAARRSTPAEQRKMAHLVEEAMRDGALGLSSGLEYEPGRYASTDELVALARVASHYHGVYASHMRNEDDFVFRAIAELDRIAREGRLPGVIDHIKLGSARVWGRTGEVAALMRREAARGVDIEADVYPYLYWQSTIRVIIPTEEFSNRALWVQGLADIGGPGHILLTTFSPDPTWAGQTITDLARKQGKDPIALIQEIIARCYGLGSKGRESVVVTAMSDDDLKAFIRNPRIAFCSDSGLHPTHPRGAGSFPRVLGHYVRDEKIIPLQEAIRKMTSLPAERYHLTDRGTIRVGKRADLVLFDPKTVADTATTDHPQSPPVGLPTVFVNGVAVLRDGQITHAHPGRPLRRG